MQLYVHQPHSFRSEPQHLCRSEHRPAQTTFTSARVEMSVSASHNWALPSVRHSARLAFLHGGGGGATAASGCGAPRLLCGAVHGLSTPPTADCLTTPGSSRCSRSVTTRSHSRNKHIKTAAYIAVVSLSYGRHPLPPPRTVKRDVTGAASSRLRPPGRRHP